MSRSATMNRDSMQRDAQYNDYADDRGPDAGEGSSAGQLDLQHYLRILRKHKWPITLFTAVITGLAAYYAFTATPIYRASSTLLIEQQKANIVSIEELYGIESEASDYYETQFELLKSRNLAQKVVERLGMWDDPELSQSARTAEAQAPAAQRDVMDDEPSGIAGRVNEFLVGIGVADDPAEVAAREERLANADVGQDADIGIPAADDAFPGTDDATGGQVAGGQGADGQVADGQDGTVLSLDPAQPGMVGNAMGDAVSLDEQGRPVDADGNPVSFDPADFGSTETQLSPEQEIVLANFMGRLGVSPVRKTKLVNLSYESDDPVKAARVANTVGQQYITSYLDAKLEMTTMASAWLNERLGELKIDLDAAEDRLIAFKEANNLVDVDGSVGRLNEQEILLLSTDLAVARGELANARDVVRTVDSLAEQPQLLESIPAIQADPLVQQVKVQQGTVQRELDELQNRYGARHPRVVDKQSELNSLTATLEGHIRRVVNTLKNDERAIEQRVASIQAKVASGRTEIQAIGTKKFELDALAREVQTKQDIYDQFFSRMTEANSADGLEQANARISDFARPPISPVKPKKQLIIALAALASLVLSMLMAFLYETMDDTIKSTSDIEGKLGLKLLGILPLIKTGLLKGRTELPLNPEEIPDKKGTFAEAVNTARTALCMDDGAQGRKIIVVTSSIPGEGKSTASINLAYSLGQLERVLLIDCDLRRPTIAKAAGLDKNVSGLSTLITNGAPARECIKRGVFGGSVDILPSGQIPDQPLELLSSKRFEKILEQLSRHYDRIVIDSAPTQAVSDALVLSRLADAVVYVVKSHDTSIELVRRGIQRLEQAGAPIAGALITQVDIDKITSYGGDYYYQGYYDYYGYTEKGDRQKRPGKIRLTQEELMRIKSDDREVNLGLDYGRDGDVRYGAGGADDFDDDMDFGDRDDDARRDAGGRRERVTSQVSDQPTARTGERSTGSSAGSRRRGEGDAPTVVSRPSTTARSRFEDDLDIL